MTIFEVVLMGEYKNNLMIPVRFRWTPSEPYFVTLTFMERGEGDRGVTWNIGRDFIATGLKKQHGFHDVIITPCVTRVSLLLSVKGHECVVIFDIKDIAEFLEATFHVIPEGQEFEGIDWDEEAKQLLE